MTDLEQTLDRVAKAPRDGLIMLLKVIQKSPAAALASGAVSRHVVDALQQNLENREVQRWGAAALEELFRRCAVVDPESAAAALLAAARAHLPAVEVQRWCFSALVCALELGEETETDSVVLTMRILEQDAMSLLASALQLHKGSPSLLESALSLVACLVMDGGDAAADEAFRTGVLGSVLSTLSQTLDTAPESPDGGGFALAADASLQQACLRALWAISESNGELGATEIAADNGLEVILATLKQEQAHVDVHKWCASVLQSLLAQGGDLVAESAVQQHAPEALVASLAKHGALGTLCFSLNPSFQVWPRPPENKI